MPSHVPFPSVVRHASTALGARLCTVIAAACLSSALLSVASGGELTLWPRGNEAYLVAGQPMPIWPALPEGLDGTSDLLLTITLPKGFTIAAVGQSTAFALHPKPLAIPSKMEESEDGKEHVYRLTIPKEQTSTENVARLALMVSPAPTAAPGDYPCRIEATLLSTKKAACAPLKGILHILEPLQGKRPKRLTLGVYNYHGYTNPAYVKALEEAVVGSGINTICDMRAIEEDGSISLTPSLKKQGLHAEIYWFWNAFAKRIRGQHPEVVAVNKNSQPDNGSTPAAATWMIANKDKIRPLLEEDVRTQLRDGFYRALVNDNEIRGMNRERTLAYGDIYNPGAMEAFAEWAKLDGPIPADEEHLATHYPDQWIDYRCWQSTQLSNLLGEAIKSVDPTVSYGFYSGYQYAGKFTGFTRQLYSVDWEKIASEGKVDFGCAGYYGSPSDLATTGKALGSIPYSPAEMYMEHFLEKKRRMPGPDEFALRLVSALLDSGGKGGVTLWYLPVLDGAGYSAVAKLSQLMAETEAFLLDGERLSPDELRLSNNVDPDSVFAYSLGERRLVIILNRGKNALPISFGWKTPLPKPDTIDLIHGRSFGDLRLIQATLKPGSYAAYITASEGN